MIIRNRSILLTLTGLALLTALPSAVSAAQGTPVADSATMPFADLADLATAAPLVAVVEVRRASQLPADRTGPVRPGWTRVYVEANTVSLLSGSAPIGAKVKYLADLKLDAGGRMPTIKKQTMVLFARPVADRPGELQLVAPDAQVPLIEAGEARLRTLLGAIVSPEAPPPVTGVRDALHTPGNLAGEGETQIFLETANGEPASIAVIRRPGQPPQWGLSTGELVDPDARPPAPATLGWYRLACSLPDRLPARAQIATDPSLRRAAARDYALVIGQLGECGRQRVY